MKSDDVDTLQILVNAATTWRNAALGQSVQLDVLVTRINGEIVLLQWNPELVLWHIRTASEMFSVKWVPNAEDETKSRWVIAAK